MLSHRRDTAALRSGLVWIAVGAGAVLGVVSRIEEVEPAFDAGVSTNFTWLGVAFLVGARAASLDWSALAGAVALTTANAGYYAHVLATDPGRPLDQVAGPVDRWFALGVTGGFVFGAAGALVCSTRLPVRVAAAVPLAALLVAEWIPAVAERLP